jgi:hypothetical protein
MVPIPGRRPEPELLREDLDRVFGRPVHSLTMSVGRTNVSGDDQTALAKLQPNDAISAFLPVLAKFGAVLEQRAQRDELRDKLCWTMREARTMTGLSKPALRELIEREPDLAIRRGGRVRWVRAEKLRAVLG